MTQVLGQIQTTQEVALDTDIDGLQNQIDNLVPSNQLISGGVVWSGVGFNYDVSALVYRILGVIYNSVATSVVLSASDPTFDRIDVIYADTTGSVGVITGTPAASPVKPNVDSTTQVEVTFVTVAAGTTSPSIVNVLVYNEDTGTPTEWAGTSNDINVDFASVTDPYSGTVSIETLSTLGTLKYIELTPASAYTINGGYLTFRLKAKQNMTTPSGRIFVGFYVGTTLVGTAIAIGGTTAITYGFDGANLLNYQLVSIPIVDFGSLPTTIDSLRIFKSTGGSTSNFFLDLIQIQEGIPAPAPEVVGHIIQDESVDLPQRAYLDFQGAGVTATDDVSNDRTIVTIPGGGASTWQPPTISLADFLNNGASSLLNANAGFQKSFSQTANDEIVAQVSLRNNGLDYDGKFLGFRIHWMLFGTAPVPGDNVIFDLEVVLVGAGEDADSKPATLMSNTIDVSARSANQLYTDVLTTVLFSQAGARVLGITLRRNSSGAGADTYPNAVDVFGFEIL